MRTCEVEGCEGEHNARGMCAKHYRRWHHDNGPIGVRTNTKKYDGVVNTPGSVRSRATDRGYTLRSKSGRYTISRGDWTRPDLTLDDVVEILRDDAACPEADEAVEWWKSVCDDAEQLAFCEDEGIDPHRLWSGWANRREALRQEFAWLADDEGVLPWQTKN